MTTTQLVLVFVVGGLAIAWSYWSDGRERRRNMRKHEASVAAAKADRIRIRQLETDRDKLARRLEKVEGDRTSKAYEELCQGLERLRTQLPVLRYLADVDAYKLWREACDAIREELLRQQTERHKRDQPVPR